MSFRVGDAPEAWRTIEVSDALKSFRNDVDGATIAVNGRCGKDGDDVPLVALTRQLFIYFTDREEQSQESVVVDGREALKTVMHAKLDGVKKGFVVYVLKKDGCVYDFMYISPPESLGAGAAGFDRFVAGFRTMGH